MRCRYQSQLENLLPLDAMSSHLVELARLYESSARPVSTAYLLMAPLSLQQLPGAAPALSCACKIY